MIRRAPCLAGVTLIENWSDRATQAFYKAVYKLIQKNPILTGHVYYRHNKKEICVDTGTFTTDNHEFVKQLTCPEDAPDLADSRFQSSPEVTLEAIVHQLVPLLDPCELTSTQIRDKLPLFGATLMLLPSNYTLISITMSHAVGDGVTFFQLVKELSLYMSGKEDLQATDWYVPERSTFEIFPPYFSNRDVQISYGAPFWLGAVKNLPGLSSRTTQILLLPKDRVQKKKRELRSALGRSDISSNDVITAALCQSCHSSDLFCFTENVRNRSIINNLSAGGNFLYEIPVSKETASHPDRLRDAIQRDGDYTTNEIPLRPFLCGRVGRITSLASITETVIYKGTKSFCTLPLVSFISEIPLDVGVIFRYNKSHWGVLHNFPNFQLVGLLAELLEDNDS